MDADKKEQMGFLCGLSIGVSESPPLVSVDEATYKAVEMAISKDMVSLQAGRLYLRPSGLVLCSKVYELQLLSDEIIFLDDFGKKLTENRIGTLIGA